MTMLLVWRPHFEHLICATDPFACSGGDSGHPYNLCPICFTFSPFFLLRYLFLDHVVLHIKFFFLHGLGYFR